MKTPNHPIITIIQNIEDQLTRLGAGGLTHLSGLTGTSFQIMTPQTRTMLLRKEALALNTCSRCVLAQKRKKVVYGEGNSAAELMFIGEGPGEVEDNTGRPFVGPAGQLLEKIIQAMNLKRADIYIANIVKCRPPGNRIPEPDEIAACFPFLKKQIALIQPRVIITLGAPASQTLIQTGTPISRLRGRFASYHGIPVMPTFHPAYLLHNPEKKRETWADVRKVMHYLKTGILDNGR
ncbi:uracil-DNA glycosylase [bacterium]|nr:uracil-DNA glycosylase [bacterium]